MTTNNLTEQLKKGELPNGTYYVRLNDDIVSIDIYDDGKWVFDLCWEEISEILAPVPSYEEYLSLTYAKEEDEKIIAEYEKENQQLKELLKECYKMLAQYNVENSEPSLGENIQLLTKIDKVLK